jgi:hypothetical protein
LLVRPRPDDVDRAIASGSRQPRRWTVGDPVDRPPREGCGEGVLGRVLGDRPVTGQPDEAGDDPAPLRLVSGGDDVVDLGHSSHRWKGRISIRPLYAIGCRDA